MSRAALVALALVLAACRPHAVRTETLPFCVCIRWEDRVPQDDTPTLFDTPFACAEWDCPDDEEASGE